MLDRNDIEAIKAIIQEENSRLDDHMEKIDDHLVKLDDRVEKIDDHLVKLDNRVEKIDDHLIKLDDRVEKIDDHMEKIDDHLIKLDDRVEKLNDRVNELENSLLDEIGRTQIYLEGKIGELQKNLEELKQYYKITKLENDNAALVLRLIEELSKRVEELEKKTA